MGRILSPLLLLQVRRKLADEAGTPDNATHYICPAQPGVPLRRVQIQHRQQRHPDPDRLPSPDDEKLDCMALPELSIDESALCLIA